MSASFAQESLLLAPPPGLEAVAEAEATLAPPPGLGAAAAAEGKAPACQVRIRGMPNGLLSNAMLEAILEEANVKDVVGFKAEPGRPTGQVSVFFSSKVAAQKCEAHFKGCQWHPSGPVKIQLTVLVREEREVDHLALQAAQLRETCQAMTEALSNTWGLAAPEKQLAAGGGLKTTQTRAAGLRIGGSGITSKLTEEDWLPKKPKVKAAPPQLFGEDPAFITLSPSLASPFSFSATAMPFRPSIKEPATLLQQGSDASTDAGESETEEGEVLAAAAVVPALATSLVA